MTVTCSAKAEMHHTRANHVTSEQQSYNPGLCYIARSGGEPGLAKAALANLARASTFAARSVTKVASVLGLERLQAVAQQSQRQYYCIDLFPSPGLNQPEPLPNAGALH